MQIASVCGGRWGRYSLEQRLRRRPEGKRLHRGEVDALHKPGGQAWQVPPAARFPVQKHVHVDAEESEVVQGLHAGQFLAPDLAQQIVADPLQVVGVDEVGAEPADHVPHDALRPRVEVIPRVPEKLAAGLRLVGLVDRINIREKVALDGKPRRVLLHPAPGRLLGAREDVNRVPGAREPGGERMRGEFRPAHHVRREKIGDDENPHSCATTTATLPMPRVR